MEKKENEFWPLFCRMFKPLARPKGKEHFAAVIQFMPPPTPASTVVKFRFRQTFCTVQTL
jgi:hypothetical protein